MLKQLNRQFRPLPEGSLIREGEHLEQKYKLSGVMPVRASTAFQAGKPWLASLSRLRLALGSFDDGLGLVQNECGVLRTSYRYGKTHSDAKAFRLPALPSRSDEKQLTRNEDLE